MPLPEYGVLKARPVARLEATPASSHYQIHVVTEETNPDYRVAVNVLSDEKPYNLLYHLDDNFIYPTTTALLELPDGFTALPSQPGQPNSLAIDFLRSNIVDPEQMKPVLFTDIGSETQLNDLLETRIQQALADPGALVFAFGDRWGPENGTPDQYFEFDPGNGIHDIHMNQGNPPPHEQDNGIWQDGGLLLYFPSTDTWTSVFLKFQSQITPTDDSGNPVGSSS